MFGSKSQFYIFVLVEGVFAHGLFLSHLLTSIKNKTCDLTGKILLEQTENTNQINVQNLASGIFMLEATISGKKSTKKFIKQ